MSPPFGREVSLSIFGPVPDCLISKRLAVTRQFGKTIEKSVCNLRALHMIQYMFSELEVQLNPANLNSFHSNSELI